MVRVALGTDDDALGHGWRWWCTPFALPDRARAGTLLLSPASCR
jgi:hypothetical protein